MQWNQLVLVTGIWRNINDFEDPKISLVRNWCATLFQEVKAIGYYFFKVLLNKETVRSLFCLALKLLNCKSWLAAFTNVPSSAVWYVVSPGEIEAINSTLRLRNVFCFFLAFDFRFCVVIRFSSPPQRPMTSDFEGFSIPDFIHYIYFPILILEKEPVFSLLNVQC